VTSFTVDETKLKSNDTTMVGYLSQKGFTITLDGTTKTIMGPTKEELEEKYGADWTSENYVEMLQAKIDNKFGAGKLTVANGATNTSSNNMLALQFSVNADSGSTFQVKSDAGDSVGISSSLSNYVDTSKTLGDLMKLTETVTGADGTETTKALYATKKNEDGTDATDSDGNTIYTLKINDVDFEVTEKTTLSSLISKINSSDTAGVTVSYSKTTKSFGFTAKETGVTGKISMDNDLAKALFGTTMTESEAAEANEKAIQAAKDAGKSDDEAAKAATYTANYTQGKDAEFTAVINGKAVSMTRSSNSIEMDGLTVNLKGTFDASNSTDPTDTSNAVTFNVTADADKIVDAVKSMINDYNSIVTSIKSAYTTYPAQKSDGSSYEPLSDDDKADMSESAIETYETKAKQGLLFMDSDLSSLYNALRDCFSSTALKSIGITTSYSGGLTTVSLDESTLRQALEDDPDSVRDKFTSSTSTGGSYDGVAQKLSTVFNRYVKTYGYTKGILIEKSGASEASASLTSNTWYNAINSLEEQIEKWQDKMSDKVDYYTTKFTNLETLVNEMNSQSSMLSGLTGSY
jgi:flagellar hook-associated protein 2